MQSDDADRARIQEIGRYLAESRGHDSRIDIAKMRADFEWLVSYSQRMLGDQPAETDSLAAPMINPGHVPKPVGVSQNDACTLPRRWLGDPSPAVLHWRWLGTGKWVLKSSRIYDGDVYVPGPAPSPKDTTLSRVNAPLCSEIHWDTSQLSHVVSTEMAVDPRDRPRVWRGARSAKVSHWVWGWASSDRVWIDHRSMRQRLGFDDIFVRGTAPKPTEPPDFTSGLPSCKEIDW